jgi:hypothetical protein
MSRTNLVAILLSTTLLAVGCATADQPVVWSKAQNLNLANGYRLDLKTHAPVPDAELSFMRQNIEQELNKVFRNRQSPDQYWIRVTITRYEEGNAFARFMLAGLGQMHLEGDVHVLAGDPPTYVRVGTFKKNYSMGGVIGGMADMKDDVVAKVGKAIADGLTAVPATTSPAGKPAPAPSTNPVARR